jgi:hypothetical protein
MPSIILPRRFTQQPQYPVEVDWSNPLTRGLAAAWIATNKGQNLVFNRAGVVSGAVGNTVNPAGIGCTFTAAAEIELPISQFGTTKNLSLYSNASWTNKNSPDTAKYNTLIKHPSFLLRTEPSAGSVANPPLSLLYWNTSGRVVRFQTALLNGAQATYAVIVRNDVCDEIYQNTTNVYTSTVDWFASSRTEGSLFIGNDASQPEEYINGAINFAYVFYVDHSKKEAFEIIRNPWQIFRRSPQVLYFDVGGGGATTLTVADSSHAHAADNLSLTSQILLMLADALHGHTADNLTLDTAARLAVQDATHVHTADNLDLTTLSVLVVAEALHSHLVDNLALSVSGATSLIVADALHTHMADSLGLTSQMLLAIADAAHAHSADNVVITSAHVLAVADALHAHTADNLSLSDLPSLSIADAGHSHSADNLTLTTAALLAIADAAHAHLADDVSLTYAATLAIVEAMHTHLADNVTLNLLVFAALDMLLVQYDRRIRTIEYDQRIRKLT